MDRIRKCFAWVYILFVSFRKFVQDSDDEDSDRGGQLLTRRSKTQEEKVLDMMLKIG